MYNTLLGDIMFGEEALLGKKEIKTDDKGRIFIPKDTKGEKDDTLAILYDKDLDIYRIYNVKVIEKILKDLKDKILYSNNAEDKIKYKKMSFELCKSILKVSKIDGQGRILIGDIYPFKEKILAIGNYDNLMLLPVEKSK